MKKKECPSCAMMIEGKSRVCPICSYEFPQGSVGIKLVAILLLILILLYFIL